MSDNTVRIILIRHAESVANTQRHLVGGRSSATPISKKGREQARQLGIYLRQQPQPQRVITSPAIRTRETARYSLEHLRNAPEIEVSDEIQEMTQGVAEGLLREDVYTPEVKDRIDREGKNFALPHEGAESMNDVANRIDRYLQLVAANSSSGDVLYIYTHGIAICCYLGKLLNQTQQEVFQRIQSLPNASLTVLEFSSAATIPRIISVGEVCE